MKRRTVLAGGIGLGATAALPGGMALAQAKEVIIATTAGLMERALQDHFYKRFEAETGIRVRSVPIELPDQWARAVAGARTGSAPFDIVTATPPDLIQHKDILLPMSRTSIAALFVIQFIYGWNQYLWPLLITTKENFYTVVMMLSRQANAVDAAPHWELIMAMAMLAMLPPVLVVVAMQRLFVRGLVDTEK